MWYVFSIATAVLVASGDALAKRLLREAPVGAVAIARFFFSALLLAPLWWFAQAPSQPRLFWTLIAMAVPIEVGAAFAYQTALRWAPLSVAVPYLAFTPVFLTFLGRFVLSERLRATGVAGALLISVGAFVLHARGRRTSVEPGQRPAFGACLMLGVSFAYAVTTLLIRRALSLSDPRFLPALYYAMIAAAMIPCDPSAVRWTLGAKRWWAALLAVGAFEAAGTFLQFHALTEAPIAYVIALKRLSLLVAVFYGRIFFNERNILARAAGAALMAGGAALILVGGAL